MRARHVVGVVLASPILVIVGFMVWLFTFSNAWQELGTRSPNFFPRHQLTGHSGVPAGDIAGLLTLEDGRIWIETASGGRYLALWPGDVELQPGTRAMEIRTGTGRTVARVGEPIHAEGGESSDAAFVDDLIDGRIPEACRGAGYWLVSEVLE